MSAKAFRRGTAEVFWTTDLRVVEYAQVVESLYWGVALLMPGDTFKRPAYSMLGGLMSENDWGVFFLFVGLLHAYVLLQSKRVGRPLHVIVLGLGTFAWSYVAVSFWGSQPPIVPAVCGYLLSAVGAFWLLLVTGVRRG